MTTLRPVLVIGLVALGARAASAETSCANLTGLTLAQATVTVATLVPAGPFDAPSFGGERIHFSLPERCRVEAVARPTSDSEIRFEVWLPVGAAWNGKFEQIGNGGFAGTIPLPGLAAGLSRGYATAATDDGHSKTDATFALGHPEKVVDFGWRAVHLTSVHAKAIIEAFYGKPAAQAYFFGCSDGGREALMEAQRFPADFNGILAGAPANEWTGLLTAGVWHWKALTATPASQIPAAKLPTIEAAIVKQCDAQDGVKDGLIDDPSRCRFDPASIRCAGTDQADCLTNDQVTALKLIYQGPRSPKTGEQIYPGIPPGAEAVSGGWVPWLVSQTPGRLPLIAWFGTQYYGQMVFEKPDWDYRTMDFDRDLGLARSKTAQALESSSPDLKAFRARGGKLIQYHGWADAAISATSSIGYYQRVKAAIGRGADHSVDDFYRLYLVPGMGHCAGGVGPNDFGNLDGATSSHGDATHDIHTALEQWVEHGTAPGPIVASGVRPGEPYADPAKATKITRLLCPFPSVARFQGKGSSDSAQSFACGPR
jgi:feruloyl esterase